MQRRLALASVAALVALVAIWAWPRPVAEEAPKTPSAAPPSRVEAPIREAPAEPPAESPPEPPPDGLFAEGCGASAIDPDGKVSLPAIDAPCEVRAVARNGGAITRGPKVRVGPGGPRDVVVEVPEMPPWEPPVPPSWGTGADEGLTLQERRDERLAYLKALLETGTLTPEQEAATRELVEQLERTHFDPGSTL